MNPRRVSILVLVSLTLLTGALDVSPAGASPGELSLGEAREVAQVKMKKMQRRLESEGAKASTVSGCWREERAVGCLGMVSGRDSFLRWRCAVPMTIRKTRASAATRRIAVKFTDPLCSFRAARPAARPGRRPARRRASRARA